MRGAFNASLHSDDDCSCEFALQPHMCRGMRKKDAPSDVGFMTHGGTSSISKVGSGVLPFSATGNALHKQDQIRRTKQRGNIPLKEGQHWTYCVHAHAGLHKTSCDQCGLVMQASSQSCHHKCGRLKHCRPSEKFPLE